MTAGRDAERDSDLDGLMASGRSLGEFRESRLNEFLDCTIARGKAMDALARLCREARDERDRLRAESRDHAWHVLLEERGVETPCSQCSGLGVRAYGSTATWRGGIGGQAITRGVCDHCWGSGDEHLHGVDLRAAMGRERELKARVREIEGATEA